MVRMGNYATFILPFQKDSWEVHGPLASPLR